MRRIFVVCSCLLSAIAGIAQKTTHDPKSEQVYIMPAVIQDGDTIGLVTLQEVVVYTSAKHHKAEFDRITRNVMKAYPYAKLTSETLREMDAELAKITSKKDRKKYIDWAEDEMKAAFEKDLRKLTFTQGRILIKLVNRETGRTGYELVKELKGGFSAFMWQGVAKLFGANLKAEFDAQREDLYIEAIVRRIERGELPVVPLPRRNLRRS